MSEVPEPADCITIRLASPEDIRGWSSGEVKQADFLKDPLDRPHPDGLFSERIFGPLFDWCCGCRLKEQPKFHGRDAAGKVCPICRVAADQNSVRRRRMGLIELAAPIVHTWFFRGRPSPTAQLLDMSALALESVADCQRQIVLDPGDSELPAGYLIGDVEFLELRGQGRKFTAGTGGQAIRLLLQGLNLAEREQKALDELKQLRAAGKKPARQKVLARTAELIGWFRASGNMPEWMVLECLPVLPPDLRPLRELPGSGTRFCSDLNLFYENILRVNNRLRDLQQRVAPSAVLRDQVRQLQRWVDALFDNARCDPPVTGASRKPLRSLTDLLQGKEGRFRQNLLGKRVDYSGRAVIVAGPKLKLNQCGLPRRIAEELFRPHLLGRLARSLNSSLPLDWPAALRSAYLALQGRDSEVRRLLREALTDTLHPAIEDWLADRDERLEQWLREALRDHRVLLNRAPSLHRMNIQAFAPVLHEGKTILLHPLVCESFGADFDGDTMAVHLPLSDAAQCEADELMRPLHNLLSPASGRPLVPNNEIVLGCYYLTAGGKASDKSSDKETRRQGDKETRRFSSPAEVILAHEHGKVRLHETIEVRLPGAQGGVRADANSGLLVSLSPCLLVSRRVSTTVGRVLFNELLPRGMPFCDQAMTRKALSAVVLDCFRMCGRAAAARLLDRIKDAGFHWATRSGLSFVLVDLVRPSNKDAVLAETQCKIGEVRQRFLNGEIGDEQRYKETIRLWQQAEDAVTARLIEEMRQQQRGGQAYLNPIYLMAHSGARSKWVQVRQLAAMRGLMARPSGDRPIVEHAITSSLREGLSIFEFWISTHGARKAGADKDALPESGDLTRKLADVSHHVVVIMRDCGTDEGKMTPRDSLRGRVSLEAVRGPNGEVLLEKNELIARDTVLSLRKAGIEEVAIRSPMTCKAPHGTCQLCYGLDLAANALVAIGTPAGILAAQSIGEPGTQLAMRTKHTGGIVTAQDMVTGLERVKALLEARPPRLPALLAESDGVVEVHSGRVLVRPASDEKAAPWVHGPVPPQRLRVQTGQYVRAGEALTDGDPWPDDLLRLRGIAGVRRYFLEECQAVYRGNGVVLDDKHFEVILACTLGRWRVEAPGDSELAAGAVVEWRALVEANQKLLRRVRVTEAGSASLSRGLLIDECNFLALCQELASAGKQPPLGVSATPPSAAPLGLTRAAMACESFLSAASFQHTRKVLLEAALQGRSDPLRGLKENVLLGRLIPAGTGFRFI